MVSSRATTVAAYLAALPPERRKEIAAVRKVVNGNLPKGFQEIMGFGMITWTVPLSRLAETYNGQPLMYAALAAQKNYCALYLMGVYSSPARSKRLQAAFAKIKKPVDMGKSCIRFQTVADLPLETIGALIAKISVDEWVEHYLKTREKTAAGRKKPKAK